MAEAQQTAAEIKRLSAMSPDAFMRTVAHYATGGTDRRCPRDVQGQALASPQLAPQALEALETAVRQVRSFLPREEGESKRAHQARLAPFRARLQAGMSPLQDVVDDLAHDEAKALAALDDATFTRRWTGFILDAPGGGPVPRRVQGLAFRSPRVAARAEVECLLMLEDPGQFMPPGDAGESRKAHEARVVAFRRRVSTEVRFLQYATQYAEARLGRMPTAPNHRAQALRLLGEAHPKELLQLLREVREGARADKDEARRETRMIRRAARSAP
ncbi:hypothetical protein ACIP9H_33625 [Streptomyces sp. NPDC088732]|uniref:hypothetical protein n=1 Tax=Streptomyces sp. NPDC088732 TaxID=3365879 RepID=UPI003817690B